MAKLFVIERPKSGPPLTSTPAPQTNDGTLPPAMNRIVMMTATVAAWSVVTITPLFASVALQTQVDNPPPRTDKQQAIVRIWEPVTWNAQWTKKTPIPDRHDTAVFTRQAERAIPIWPQPDWPTQVTKKTPIPDRHDSPPVRVLHTAEVDRWNAVTIGTLWSTFSFQNGAAVAPPDNPPPRQVHIESLAAHWELRPLQAVWFNRVIDLSLLVPSNPSLLSSILNTWIPVDYPQPRRAVVTPSGPPPQADNPPFSSRHPIFDIIQGTWMPPDPLWQEGKPFINPAQIDQPPFGQRLWLMPTIALWEPGPPQPIIRIPVLTPSGPDPIPPPSINYQDAGDGPRKKKKERRREQDALFAAIEQTLRETMAGPQAKPAARTAQPVMDLSRGTAAALDQLRLAAQDRQDLSVRVAQLQRDLEAYQRKILEEDEDDWMRL